ncbi:ABC transporter permease [Propylenella binzhouense]|uniref:ABC transporter permease n=1 Tax=Propylenella binzhouense TaxID=2555902 RepID=A0A964T6S7_9HYPH|nr:ABC transporter permease [Propylenella binzhouense]MYZ48462.1 ABC transporter permease [Propylenella binzhouense]
MNEAMLIGLLAATVSAATPLLLAGLGELVAERSGVLNLGLEGLMLTGAMTAVVVTASTGSVLGGIAAAVAVTMAMGAAFAFLTVTIRADHIVTGLAIVLVGDGLSQFFGKAFVGVNLQDRLAPLAIPVLRDLPVLGPVLFRQNVLVYFSLLAVPLVWLFLYRTRPGLALRAAGERPSAVDVAGWNVVRIRYLAVIFGAGMAGLAGAFLSVGYLGSWANGMTAGQGWIALALVIFAAWHPVRLLFGAYLFGFAYIMVFQAQVLGGVFQLVSVYLMQMAPYLLALLVLMLIAARSRGRGDGTPAALAVPYVREERT